MQDSFGPPSGDVDPAIPLMVMAIVGSIAFLVFLLIQGGICYVLYRAANGIPERYRTVSPGQAFLLMIPCFSIIWVFIYTKQLSQNFRSLFNAYGEQTDDCGEALGLWWGILPLCSMIPFVGAIAGIASLVVMIMYLVKVSDCRNRAMNLPAEPMSGQPTNFQF